MRTFFGSLFVCTLALSAVADVAPNSLMADRTTFNVSLTWGAGSAPYAVYRSTSPVNVAVSANLIAQTSNTFYQDPMSGLPASLYFYSVGNPPCTANSQCNDGNLCNGEETCQLATGTCSAGTPLVCSDGISCTDDSCVPASGCQFVDNGACNDVNACTNDTCSAPAGCAHTNVPDGTPCGPTASCQAGQCLQTCFTAGTLVRTDRGARPIEKLRKGDLIVTSAGVDGRTSLTPLIELEKSESADVLAVEVGNGDVLNVTGEHHLWVGGSRWVRARELSPADTLVSANGRPVPVRSARRVETTKRVLVYNLRLEGAGAYFVGESGVLASSCHLTLNLSERPGERSAAPPATGSAAQAGAPPLFVYDSTAPSLGLGAWAQRVGTKDDHVIVLDVMGHALKIVPLDGLRTVVSSGAEPSGVRTVPLHTDELAFGALLHEDILFVSFFSGNSVEMYRWVPRRDGQTPDLAYLRRLEFGSETALGLSGMAVVGDSLFIAGSGWVCRSPNCSKRFDRPHLFVVDLRSDGTAPFPDVTPANVNPVGLFVHGPDSKLFLINSGDSENGYSSLQRVGRDGTLGPEIRLPANARVNSAFDLGHGAFGLLQMSGEYLFVIDAGRERLAGFYRFDGERFVAMTQQGAPIPDRSLAILHDTLTDPASPGRFYVIDTKGRRLIHAGYDAVRGIETLGVTPLPGTQTPSWGVWLEK